MLWKLLKHLVLQAPALLPGMTSTLSHWAGMISFFSLGVWFCSSVHLRPGDNSIHLFFFPGHMMKSYKIRISQRWWYIKQQPIPQTIKIGKIQYTVLPSDFSSNSKFIVLFIYSIDVNKHHHSLLLTNPSLKQCYVSLRWRFAVETEAWWHSTKLST